MGLIIYQLTSVCSLEGRIDWVWLVVNSYISDPKQSQWYSELLNSRQVQPADWNANPARHSQHQRGASTEPQRHRQDLQQWPTPSSFFVGLPGWVILVLGHSQKHTTPFLGCISLFFFLIFDVQHSNWTITYITKCSPQCIFTIWHIWSYYSIIDSISYAVFIPLT